MEIPFSLPLTGFRSQHVTHFQPVRTEEQSVSWRWGLGWGGQVEGDADEKIFVTPEKTRKGDVTPFSLFCMGALTGINSDIASILMMKPAWRMAGGRNENKMGPDDVTELQWAVKQSWHGNPIVWGHITVLPSLNGDVLLLGHTVFSNVYHLILFITAWSGVLSMVYSASLFISTCRHLFCFVLTFKNSPLPKTTCDMKLISEILFFLF